MPKTSVQARAQSSTNGNGTAALFDSPAMGVVNPFTFFTINMAGYQNDGIPAWSYFPQVRDMYLRILSRSEPIMASALYSMTSRVKSLRWNVTGGRNDKKYYQGLYAEADGGEGFGSFIAKVTTDLLTQDNGSFIELVGAGREDKPLTGKVREIWHMDSAQCWRTFDREYPVIYIDPMNNTYHKMHHTRVIRLSSFPQSDERARGIGFCAVSRALRLMQTMKAVQIYRDEKVTGKFNRGLIYGNGITVKQFEEAIERSEQVAESINFTVYKDLPVLLSMMPDMKLNVLDLASLPDGFDYEKDITLYVYCLALAFGTDAREFWPATASGATKADATIQHIKAQGKGIADIIKMYETAFNWHVQPENGKSDFEYDFTDDEQDKAVAELHKIKAENIGFYQQQGWIDALEGRALAINEGLIDPKKLLTLGTPEVADDTSPMEQGLVLPDERPEAEPVEPDMVDEFEFDPAEEGAKAGEFDEAKHERDKSGRFGSGGGQTTEGQIGTSPGGMKFKLTPLADRLKNFLAILNQAGSYKDGQLTIKRQARDRSRDLQTYLRNKGFPNTVVTSQRVGKGFVYSVDTGGGELVPTKRKRRRRKKAATEQTTTSEQTPTTRRKRKKTDEQEKTLAAYGKKEIDDPIYRQYRDYQDDMKGRLEHTLVSWGDTVHDTHGLSGKLATLNDDLLDEIIRSTSAGYRLGGGKTDGSSALKEIGAKQGAYLKYSFIPALKVAIENAADFNAEVGLQAKDIDDQIQDAIATFIGRLRSYAGSFWEAIWRGAGDGIEITETEEPRHIKRMYDREANNCPDCPGLEGEYDSFDEMVGAIGLPGDGSTPCLGECHCVLYVETEPGSGQFDALPGAGASIDYSPLYALTEEDIHRAQGEYGVGE